MEAGTMCPCCNRRIPRAASAPKIDKRLAQDLARAESSLDALRKAFNSPGEHESFRVAVQDEIGRLLSAKSDHRLLWNIFRRRDKGAPYFIPGPAAIARPAVRKAA